MAASLAFNFDREGLQAVNIGIAPRLLEIVNNEVRTLLRTRGRWREEYGPLAWDGRELLNLTHPISQVQGPPAGTFLETSRKVHDRPTAPLFKPLGDVGQVEIDPIFLRPVRPAPGATSANAVFRLQLHADLLEGQTPPLLRFADSRSGDPLTLPRPPIGATLRQLADSLRHDTGYSLGTSVDGLDWERDTARMLRLRDGSSLQLPRRLDPLFATPPALVVRPQSTETVLLETSRYARHRLRGGCWAPHSCC